MTIKFTDPDLQKTHQAFRNKFLNFYQELDNLSNDIKNLESFLHDCKIKISYDFSIRSSESSGFVQDYLSWDEYNGTFRLLFKQRVFINENQLHAYYCDQIDIQEIPFSLVIPVIETKLDIRKKLKSSLSEFYESYANYISMENAKEDDFFSII